MKKLTIFSFGHSNRTIWEFIGKLKSNRIDVLVDVRTIPISRYCPHFNQNALQGELSKQSIKYLWKGRNLGGRGINEGYEEAIDELTTMARQGMRVCVMCSENDYRKCHRYLTLTPSFEARGLKAIHIQYENGNEKRTNNK